MEAPKGTEASFWIAQKGGGLEKTECPHGPREDLHPVLLF